MFAVPNSVMSQYSAVLRNRQVDFTLFSVYKKWLRYFHDFRTKYAESYSMSVQVRLFLEKLREKKQTVAQRQQAAHAVTLYFEMQKQAEKSYTHDIPSLHEVEPMTVNEPVEKWVSPLEPAFSLASYPLPSGNVRVSQYCEAGYEEKSDSPEWDSTLATLAAEIKVRHYSRKTLRTYANWSRRFQRFLKNKPPQELSTADVKAYLTYLAVKCNVAASTQNQAFQID